MRKKNRATHNDVEGGKGTDADEASDDDNIEEVKAVDSERLFFEDEERKRAAADQARRKKKPKRSKKRKMPEVAINDRYSGRALDSNVLEMLDNIEEKDEGEETKVNERVAVQQRPPNPSTSSIVSSASHVTFKNGFEVMADCEVQQDEYRAGITPSIGASAMLFLTESESRRKRMPQNRDWARKRKLPAYNFSPSLGLSTCE